MKTRTLFYPAFIFLSAFLLFAQDSPISPETEECLDCHSVVHPGIVASWKAGRHAHTTPAQALKKDTLARRVSSEDIDAKRKHVVVGCYECHSLNTDKHKDAFEHNGFKINVVVSSNDCAACHAVEARQYDQNIMAHAYDDLVKNSVYQNLMKSVNQPITFEHHGIKFAAKDSLTDAESCLYCHGTRIKVNGMFTKETNFGEMEFPRLSGWPNQGVGRINPDGSLGSCTSCHPRHDFSIETARKPYTCAECHKGPDVPAYKVYQVSKHGNIVSSQSKNFNFKAVPWKVGRDFTAPTCAACHTSLLVNEEGDVVAERTHRFNDRLAWRIFGAPYAHPHPISADLTKIKNSAGLPLSTELDGTPVSKFLISKEEQQARNQRMQHICLTCHSSNWVENHFARLENTIRTTNALTRTATNIMSEIWQKGFARGIPQNANPFDEHIERIWTSIWLFHANSVRFTSAMGGGGDYGVFANGRYPLTEKIFQLQDWLDTHQKLPHK